ncbi:MAG: ABC transporter ATP-binding protein [Armatimonadota bacterium]|nr:ABC transporter ATP-binding protein [Armatimonadota bacterium]MDR7484757.1 ABC transporter ATP-binding protein [Armatimonadota bacterium]MDR7531872.1 ABC transporter ATP-binding protein [Armatimonadota bacterium]MDR7534783.1 ABC transporter ATP-binding protein [Armatimonadota bacterium]
MRDTPAPLLQTAGLRRTFGGLVAVRDVDFRLARGEIRALIGPNGAGKTTLASMISGRIAPSAGRIVFDGRDITAARAPSRVALGIVCTFQLISVFRNLTVFENVALAAQRRLLRGPGDIFRVGAQPLARLVREALDAVGFREAWTAPAAALPYGHQRLLELAMALALRPRLLILDEPTQGLAPEETAGLVRLVRQIAHATTVLLIEHNMRVVLDLAHRVTVMDQGRIIAEGTPADVEADPGVQRVYLGER